MFPIIRCYVTSIFTAPNSLPELPPDLSRAERQLLISKTNELFCVVHPVTNKGYPISEKISLNVELEQIKKTGSILVNIPLNEVVNINNLGLLIFKTYGIDELSARNKIVNTLINIPDAERKIFVKRVLKILKISPDYIISSDMVLNVINRLENLTPQTTFEDIKSDFRKTLKSFTYNKVN